MDVRKTHLYKTLLPCIRKQDRERFREELQRAADAPRAWFVGGANTIAGGFLWDSTPQGSGFWDELHDALRASGNYAENDKIARGGRSDGRAPFCAPGSTDAPGRRTDPGAR